MVISFSYSNSLSRQPRLKPHLIIQLLYTKPIPLAQAKQPLRIHQVITLARAPMMIRSEGKTLAERPEGRR